MPSRADIEAAFKVFSANDNVSADELKSILLRPIDGQPSQLSAEDVDTIYKAFTAKADGEIAIDELVAAWEEKIELYGKKPGIDPDYDLIMDEQLARNEYPEEKIKAALAAPHTALAAKFATPEVWAKYKNKKSSGPAKWTLARAINTGIMYPSSFVGCHAGDRESYDDFADFFYPVIEVNALRPACGYAFFRANTDGMPPPPFRLTTRVSPWRRGAT